MEINQTPNEIYYLGPQGTFTDYATDVFINNYKLHNAHKTSIKSITQAFNEMETNRNAVAVLPFENSIEGIVRETIDNLIMSDDKTLKIISEQVVSISQNLITYAKDISQIKTVISHPQAIAQCRKFLQEELPNAKISYSESTAKAVCSIEKDDYKTAAIGSKHCAKINEIPILREAINDEKTNQTRFILLAHHSLPKTENSKTSITFSTANKPGALNKIISVLEEYNINMTYIDSRPSKKHLGEYTFFIDIDGHIHDDNVAKAMFQVISNTKMFKHLGSYSRV